MSTPNHQNLDEDLPLLEHIGQRSDGMKPQSIAHALDKLALPAPQDHEYFITSDFGYLVLMSPLGCTLRITSNESCPPIDHPRIVQPLKRFCFEAHRLEVFPGLKLKNSLATAIRLHSLLHKDRILFNDDMPRNCAAIPRKALKSIFNYSVVCDIGACTDHRNVDLHDDDLPLFPANDNKDIHIQEKAYKHLRAAFESGDMQATWKLCAENKAQGILRADWEKPPLRLPQALILSARKYSARLASLAL